MRSRVRTPDGEGEIVGGMSGGSRGFLHLVSLDGRNVLDCNAYTDDELERIPNPKWLALFHEMPEASQMDMIERLHRFMQGQRFTCAETLADELRNIAAEGGWTFEVYT